MGFDSSSWKVTIGNQLASVMPNLLSESRGHKHKETYEKKIEFVQGPSRRKHTVWGDGLHTMLRTTGVRCRHPAPPLTLFKFLKRQMG